MSAITDRQGAMALLDTMPLTNIEKEKIIDLLSSQTRAAWITGKDYGWNKAWTWKKKIKTSGQSV